MLTARRFCSVLAILALVLGAANTAAYAGGMADSMIASTADSMDQNGCDGCVTDADVVVCLKTTCVPFAALLFTAATVPGAGLLQRFPSACEGGSGRILFPDTGPPRTVVLG